MTSSKTTIFKFARFSSLAALCLWAAPAGAQNLITNGTFDADSAPWWPHASSTEANPADNTLAAADGQLCATMTAGGKNPWDVIVGYSGIALTKGQRYRVAFNASADVERTIKFKVGLGDTPYTDYFIKTVSVGVDQRLIEYTYLNLRDDAMAQFQLQIGSLPGKICVDNVVVEPVPEPTLDAYITPSTTGKPLKNWSAMVKMGTAVDTPIFLSSPKHNQIVANEFSAVTPANSMKMNLIQPARGTFDFTDTDALLAWAETNSLEFRGHPLIWHTQAPGWLTDGTFTEQEMIDIMYAHIDGVMTKYKGRIPYWDVVNEAINVVDGVADYRKTFWHDRIGPKFIELAFARARMNDPAAKLLYNDYNSEKKGDVKGDRVFELVKGLKEKGLIDAVGLQGHFYILPNGGTEGVPNYQAIRDNMARYNDIGVQVHITECDFRIGKPLDANKTEVQNKFFTEMLQACVDAPNCDHFTVWGLSDVDSWVPSTFKEYDYAHIYDANLVAKPAYQALSQVFAKYNPDGTLVGSTPPPPAPTAKEDDGGCSVNPHSSRGGSWLATALALFGITVLTRRVSKRARS